MGVLRLTVYFTVRVLLTLVIDFLSLVLRMLVLKCLLTVSFISILTVYLILDVFSGYQSVFYFGFCGSFCWGWCSRFSESGVGVNEIYFLLR